MLLRLRPQSGDVAFAALLNQRTDGVLLTFGDINVSMTGVDSATCPKLTLLGPTVCLKDVKVLLASVKATAE